jgi:Asp-tRNA(Asn)/Glu-tRNA(Gln) amidotransferase A subunit family amidase
MVSLLDILRRIEAGELTPDTAIRGTIEAISSREDEIRAFVRLSADARAGAGGPLRGIAVGVKDIIDTTEFPTEMGCPAIYGRWQPRADAAVVTALKQAGATIAGKTKTTAFAASDPPDTRNPHNLAHTPGGSSSGSAAAVGAGVLPLALGTQTAGSVIRPASFCGAYAIKPSFRLIPTVGVKCFSWSLDTLGLFAGGVADLAYALAALTDRPDLKLSTPGNGPRIGVVAQYFAGEPDADAEAALDRAARAVERAGATVRTIALSEIFGQAWRAQHTIQTYEAKHAYGWEYRERYSDVPPGIRRTLDAAQKIEPAAYDEARRTAHRVRRAMNDVFADIDALLTFSAPGAAPAGFTSTGDAKFNRLWTLMGMPCVNIPGYVASGNLPVGVQVVAPFGQDARALAVAHFLDEALIKAA